MLPHVTGFLGSHNIYMLNTLSGTLLHKCFVCASCLGLYNVCNFDHTLKHAYTHFGIVDSQHTAKLLYISENTTIAVFSRSLKMNFSAKLPAVHGFSTTLYKVYIVFKMELIAFFSR